MSTCGVGVMLFGLDLGTDDHDGVVIPYSLLEQVATVGWTRRSCVVGYGSSFYCSFEYPANNDGLLGLQRSDYFHFGVLNCCLMLLVLSICFFGD